MASTSFEPRWGWPSATDTSDDNHRTDAPTPPTPEEEEQASGAAGTSDTPPPEPTPTQKQRRYSPRTCRICLEVVNPTTEIDDSFAGRVFSNKTRVRYLSEDPELGRLISPCKCKGSQRYVHEGCLQAWRNASPLSDRNYWRCPTCHFEYRLERLRWGRWLSSRMLRVTLTLFIMVATIFALGFIADPILGFWDDPFGSIVGGLMDIEFDEPILADDGPSSWAGHFLRGFLSLGILGFLKTMFFMSPFNWINLRFGGAGRRRRAAGRDRMETINWGLVLIGVLTFLGATWKFVNHLMAKTLENARDRVVDVQEDEPDEDEADDDAVPADTAPEAATDESRKDK